MTKNELTKTILGVTFGCAATALTIVGTIKLFNVISKSSEEARKAREEFEKTKAMNLANIVTWEDDIESALTQLQVDGKLTADDAATVYSMFRDYYDKAKSSRSISELNDSMDHLRTILKRSKDTTGASFQRMVAAWNYNEEQRQKELDRRVQLEKDRAEKELELAKIHSVERSTKSLFSTISDFAPNKKEDK